MKIQTALVLLFLPGLLLAGCNRANPPSRPSAPEASTPTLTATPAPRPSSTPLPTPTPTPQLVQLTAGGCCVMPSWSPDSRQILFVDKPSADAPAGLYAVDILTGVLNPPQWSGRVGLYSPNRNLIAYPDKFTMVVERPSTGDRWTLPGILPIVFAPDNQHLAWDNDVDTTGPYDQRPSDVFVAGFDERKPVRVVRVYGGGLVGWLSGGMKLMYLGRPSLDVHERTLTVLDLTTNMTTTLVTVERLSGITVSNEGTWISYNITFDVDSSRNGIWVQRTDGSQARRLEMWGAYQWRDDSHLLVIPMRKPGDPAFEVWQVDAASGKAEKLTDPVVTPLQILNGDWRVSPDGRYIVYVNSKDRNLWLLTLPAL